MKKPLRDLTLKEFLRRIKIGDIYIVGSITLAVFSAGIFTGFKYYEIKSYKDYQQTIPILSTEKKKNEISNIRNSIDSSSNSINLVSQGDSNTYNLNTK